MVESCHCRPRRCSRRLHQHSTDLAALATAGGGGGVGGGGASLALLTECFAYYSLQEALDQAPLEPSQPLNETVLKDI